MTVMENHTTVPFSKGAPSAIQGAGRGAMVFGHLPPPAKVFWHLVGKRTYRRRMTVRGGQLV